MGQRLNIEIKINGEVQANAYYHWSGYTSSAIKLTEQILLQREDFLDKKEPKLSAIRLLETTGAGLTQEELEIAKEEYSEVTFGKCNGRNSGLIAISEDGMNETRIWEEARVTIDFDEETVDFNVWSIWDKEEYLDEYEKLPEKEINDSNFNIMSFETFLNDFSEKDMSDLTFIHDDLVYVAIE